MLERFAWLRFTVLLMPVVVGCGSAATTPEPKVPTTSHTTTATPNPPQTEERGQASYYSDRLAGRSTASGEPYNPKELTAAHRTLPFGTIVRVWRPKNNLAVEVRINDRGPNTRGRIVDLSRRGAEEIGLVRDGVDDVVLTVVALAPKKKKRKR